MGTGTEAEPSKRRSTESTTAPKAPVPYAPISVVQSICRQLESSHSITRAPEARMVNPVPEPQFSTSTQSSMSGQSSAAPILGLAPHIEHPYLSPDTSHGNSQPLLSSASAREEVLQLAGSNYDAPFFVDSPVPLKTELVAPSLLGLEHNSGSSSAQGSYHSSMQLASTSADTSTYNTALEKPKLYFAIENSKGMPDTSASQLISGPRFRDSSLSDFFSLVASRSGKSIESLNDITLRYTWINQNAVVVNKNVGEEPWEDIKEDVLDFFRMSREDNCSRRRFHIWVRAGDSTMVGKNASRDDI